MGGLERKMSVSSNASQITSIVKTNKKNNKKPLNFVFKETAEQQEERIKKSSPYGSLETWKIIRFIVKTGDDLRQEQFAM